VLGAAAQDYLKNIYKMSGSGRPLTPSMLAERLCVTPAAVTRMVQRLGKLKLVNYARNQELALTPAGERIALEVIRHHRLLEAYLHEALGYPWDRVDAEAEKLEHVISEEFEERIDRFLGHPSHDPHGDPIPTKQGYMDPARHGTLSELAPGERSLIRRVTDRDPEMLRFMAALGLVPATWVEMVGKAPYGGPLTVRVGDVEHAIGRELADNVFVAAAE